MEFKVIYTDGRYADKWKGKKWEKDRRGLFSVDL